MKLSCNVQGWKVKEDSPVTSQGGFGSADMSLTLGGYEVHRGGESSMGVDRTLCRGRTYIAFEGTMDIPIN